MVLYLYNSSEEWCTSVCVCGSNLWWDLNHKHFVFTSTSTHTYGKENITACLGLPVSLTSTFTVAHCVYIYTVLKDLMFEAELGSLQTAASRVLMARLPSLLRLLNNTLTVPCVEVSSH